MSDRVVRLRASPASGIGGMYATGFYVDDVVRTAAIIPETANKQIWRLRTVKDEHDKKDKVIIALEDGQNHPAWVWSSIGELPAPKSPVILAEESKNKILWIVQPIDNGIPDAFTLIHPDPRRIGVTWYAGTADRQVIFKTLPLDIPDVEKPYWVITKAAPPPVSE